MSFAALQARVNSRVLTRLGNKGASGIILLDGVEVNADFLTPYAQGMADGMAAEMSEPQLVLASTDVPAGVRGKSVVADGGNYKVAAGPQPDGFGLSTLVLERA